MGGVRCVFLNTHASGSTKAAALAAGKAAAIQQIDVTWVTFEAQRST